MNYLFFLFLHFPDGSQMDCQLVGPDSLFVTGYQADADVIDCVSDKIFANGFDN